MGQQRRILKTYFYFSIYLPIHLSGQEHVVKTCMNYLHCIQSKGGKEHMVVSTGKKQYEVIKQGVLAWWVSRERSSAKLKSDGQ